MIKIERFSKSYGETLAVDDLTFAVEAGEILGLVGPNGAGKTTTLRVLAGILPPDGGALEVGGYNIVKEPILAKGQLALIPDEPSLFESMTAWEHLEFTACLYGVTDWRGRADQLLRRLEMDENRDRMADELSRGMRQKVTVACALLHEPRALLLDEPFTGLDPKGIRTLYEAVKDSVSGGAAAILSSHLLGQIENLCTKFLILARGRRLFYGSKGEIRAKLPTLSDDASLEEIFFRATEADAPAAQEKDPP